jgi:hypothetical protein
MFHLARVQIQNCENATYKTVGWERKKSHKTKHTEHTHLMDLQFTLI